MDYTKNHHLPQWVKSDRIMMDDFNAAFANIDKGLSDRSQAVDNLSGQITSVSNTLSQQITDRALESTTFNRFCLAAYNHYHLAKLSDHAGKRHRPRHDPAGRLLLYGRGVQNGI